MKGNLFKILSVLLLLSWSVPNASAGILGIYAGASVGTSETEGGADDTATKLYAGYRVLGPLAIEVAQVDMGQYGLTSIDGLSVDAVVYLPLGIVTVFAKAGMYN